MDTNELLLTISRQLERIESILLEQKKENSDEILDNQDVCSLLNISKRTLQKYRHAGIIPFHSIGGKTYFRKSDILEILEKKKNK